MTPGHVRAVRARLARVHTLRRSLAASAVGVILVRVANFGLTSVLAIILARALGPQEYGVYSFAYASILLIGVPVHLGIPNLTVREVVRYVANADYRRLRGFFRRSVHLTVVISMGLILVAWVTGLVLLDVEEYKLGVFFYALALIPLIGFTRLTGAVLRGFKNVTLGQIPDFVLRPGFTLVFVGVLSFVGLVEAHSAMVAHALAAAGALCVAFVLMRHRMPRVDNRVQPAYETKLWTHTLISLSVVGGMHVILTQTDLVLLGLLRSDAEVGVYRTAVQGAMVTSLGFLGVSEFAAPYISGFFHGGETAKLQSLVTWSSRLALSAAVPITVIFAFYGEYLLRLAVGNAYIAAHVPLVILSMGQVLKAAYAPATTVLNMTGQAKAAGRILGATAGLNAAASVILILVFGTVGAAYATSMSILLWNLLMYVKAWRMVGVKCSCLGTRR